MIVPKSVSYELETSLSFSLPIAVGQSDLLLDFWNFPATLETFAYRKTRFGSFVWRVGTLRTITMAEREEACTAREGDNSDRLTIVRSLISRSSSSLTSSTSVGRDDRVVSELKSLLLSDRTVRYEDSLTYETNIRYPLILEDRLSVEIQPLSGQLERDLLLAERDTSDNNLGINHEHRLSVYIGACIECQFMFYSCPRLSRMGQERRATRDRYLRSAPLRCSCGSRIRFVRISLRSSLNEYHEIAYRYELECEQDANGPGATTDVTGEQAAIGENEHERRARHETLISVFREISVPSLSRFWPRGLSRESIPYSPCKTLLDSLQTTRIVSGSSYLTHERLFESLLERSSSAKNDLAVRVKLKYDGYRSYAWYAMGQIWVDSARLELPAERRDLLCGLYVYQMESDRETVRVNDENTRRSRRIFTEVSFVMDHRAIGAINGGGALARQIEVSEYGGSTEQKNPTTAYLLSTSTERREFWPAIVDSLQRAKALDVIRVFVTCCSRCAISYVAKVSTRSSLLLQRKQQRGRSDARIDVNEEDGASDATVQFLLKAQTTRRLTVGRLTRDYLSFEARNNDDETVKTRTKPIAKRRAIANLSSLYRALAQWGNDTYSLNEDPLMRILIPVTIDFSMRVIERMCRLWYSDDTTGAVDAAAMTSTNEFAVGVSRPYMIPRDIAPLLRDYRQLCSSDRRLSPDIPLDGLLIAGDEATRDCYEKLKLRQTIDVFVTRDCRTLCSVEGPFATRPETTTTTTTRRRKKSETKIKTITTTKTIWNIAFAPETIQTATSRELRELRIYDLPKPTCDSGQIAELEFRDMFAELGTVVLRFLRWRTDKTTADSAIKIRNILSNESAASWIDGR